MTGYTARQRSWRGRWDAVRCLRETHTLGNDGRRAHTEKNMHKTSPGTTTCRKSARPIERVNSYDNRRKQRKTVAVSNQSRCLFFSSFDTGQPRRISAIKGASDGWSSRKLPRPQRMQSPFFVLSKNFKFTRLCDEKTERSYIVPCIKYRTIHSNSFVS